VPRIMSKRPSPAMIVALVALFVALGGTTYAVSVPKRSVGPAQIRSKAVRTKHIKSRNVSRSKIARNAIDSSLVKKDSIHGSDILESSLGPVPNATKAVDALNAGLVGGRSVKKLAFIAPAGTGPTIVVSLSGLTLTARCDPGSPPALSVSAITSVGGALIHSSGAYSAAGGTPWYLANDTFDVTSSFDPLPSLASGSNVSGVLTYVRQDAEVVTVTFLAQETTSGCVFAGNAIG
jgi:hypothetical protein